MVNKSEAHLVVYFPNVVRTTFGKQLLKERSKITQQFSKFKEQGLKQPCWYGKNRYLLHVQLVFRIHNNAYLF